MQKRAVAGSLAGSPRQRGGRSPGQAQSPAPQEDINSFLAAPRTGDRRLKGLGGCLSGGGRGDRAITARQGNEDSSEVSPPPGGEGERSRPVERSHRPVGGIKCQ